MPGIIHENLEMFFFFSKHAKTSDGRMTPVHQIGQNPTALLKELKEQSGLLDH